MRRDAGKGFSELELVEKPAITLFAELGWKTLNLYYEVFGAGSTVGRDSERDVVLVPRLNHALRKLNPTLPAEVVGDVIAQLTLDRAAMAPAAANREVHRLITDGVRVKVRQPYGAFRTETARVFDWREPANNDFLLASQFWVRGDLYERRADLVGFVNGLPLLFVELKASHKNLYAAFDENLADYKTTIPQLFWPNALIILSNGSDTKVGTLTSGWEHFAEWKKINAEGEEGVVSLETAIRGTCEPGRLLDIIENFTVYSETGRGLIKVVGKYHQYIGVNSAFGAVRHIQENEGRLGVFWHTQGSGKSVSMLFLSQKVLRTMPGNWTFVVVTDRRELDDQIYGVFADASAITEPQAHAESGEHLRRLLSEDHRYVFTLIQKFGTGEGESMPVLSNRSDIIVITDEAHRSQYDQLALNMRRALPNAAFIAFTGTPLIAIGEERTREVFGDYVSVYNFRDSIVDGATVPLFYENRIPELQITNEDFSTELDDLLAAAELDDRQEARLEREFGRQYHLITRIDRLRTIADDLVEHFSTRAERGKAMVVSIDKATAVRMYDLVKERWTTSMGALRSELVGTKDSDVRAALEDRIAWMQATDMAVVVSQSQNEAADLAEKGLDILPHRKRMVTEDLATKFKDPADPFRLVFVCAMWMTGFDAPSCSTIYLDRPMKNHTLMQTIARANRVYPGKTAGRIVDYVGVFRDLQKALAIYGSGSGGGIGEGDTPVQDVAELAAELRVACEAVAEFTEAQGVDLESLLEKKGFDFIAVRDDAVDLLLATDETKKRFVTLQRAAEKLLGALLPDATALEFVRPVSVLKNVRERIASLEPAPSVEHVVEQVAALLDDSVGATPYHIELQEKPTDYGLIDLSLIDFDALRARFEAGRKRIEAQRLRAAVTIKVSEMVTMNRTRADLAERFERLIDEYNAGSQNVEVFFEALLAFAASLTEEEQRGIAAGLTEEELAIFDLLTRPEPQLTKAQEGTVKKTAQELLDHLKTEKLVLDWRKKQESRAAVRQLIEVMLDRMLPADPYPKPLYDTKVDLVYQHIFESYFGGGLSLYAELGQGPTN
jgi:type I restriction enzyme R subunit